MKLLITLLAAVISLMTAEYANAATIKLRGVVISGLTSAATPLSDATITVYRVNFDPNPNLNERRINQATPAGQANSGLDGHFEVDVNLCENCRSLFYALATLHDRPRVALATVVGLAIDPNKTVIVNEMTTTAMAYAFARFFKEPNIIEGAELPLGVAKGFADQLAEPYTGAPSPVIVNPPNANQTNTWQELGTLANILASCVRNIEDSCSQLYSDTGTAGDDNTLQAFVNLAHHPADHVRDLFDLGERTKPFTPALVRDFDGPDASDNLRRLDAFTVAIKVNATGRINGDGKEVCPWSGPGNIVFDLNGYAWVINNTIQGTPYSTSCQIVMQPDGRPSFGDLHEPASPLVGGGILGQGFGITIDINLNVWSGNFGWGGVNPQDPSGRTAGSVSEYSQQHEEFLSPLIYGYTGAVCRVQGVAADKDTNIWIAGWGDDTVQVFPKGATGTPFVTHVEQDTQPFGIAIDADGAAWVSNEGKSTLSKFTLSGNTLTRRFEVPVSAVIPPPEHSLENPPPNPCLLNEPPHPKPPSVHPKGLAIDKQGNAWVVASAADAVTVVDTQGHQLGSFTADNLVRPWGVSVDSRNHAWVANFGNPIQATPEQDYKYNITELCGATVEDCPAGLNMGGRISPRSGYTLPSGGDPVLLHNGDPLYGANSNIQSFKPLMRMTAVGIDTAGNLWALNNWKPESINDTLLGNPGGDGIVIFIGLAAPVKPVLYSSPPHAP